MKSVSKVLIVLLSLAVFTTGAVAQAGEQTKEPSKVPVTPSPGDVAGHAVPGDDVPTGP